MTARVLPATEYDRLTETDAAALIPVLTAAARVIVVESAEGRILACHVLQPIVHAEGLWIHPDHRKRGSAGRRLWALVQQTARDHFGVSHVATGCASDEVERLLRHVGATKLPDHYMVPVGGV